MSIYDIPESLLKASESVLSESQKEYKIQKRLEKLRKEVEIAYKEFDKSVRDEKAKKKWLAAVDKYDKYLDSLPEQKNAGIREEDCGCDCDCEDCKANEADENPCQDGYEMVGTKMKDGKKVPNCVPIKEDVNSFLNNVLSEKAPPDEKIKKWLEDPKVQASFKDQYGERYKEVMFGKAWKMYDDKQEEKGNE